MKKEMILLIVGVILIISGIASIFYFSRGIIGDVETVTLGVNETKEEEYSLEEGQYSLIINPEGPVHFSFKASNGSVMEEGNASTQTVVDLGELPRGNYTLEVKNRDVGETDVVVILQEKESLMSMGVWALVGSGVCFVGIIMLIIGVILMLKSRKRSEGDKEGSNVP